MRHLAGGKAARALTGTHTTWQLPTSSPVPFSIDGAQGVEPEARLKANLRFAPAQGTGDEVSSCHQRLVCCSGRVMPLFGDLKASFAHFFHKAGGRDGLF